MAKKNKKDKEKSKSKSKSSKSLKNPTNEEDDQQQQQQHQQQQQIDNEERRRSEFQQQQQQQQIQSYTQDEENQQQFLHHNQNRSESYNNNNEVGLSTKLKNGCTAAKVKSCLRTFIIHLFSHVGLCFIVCSYAVCGGFLFFYLEFDQQQSRRAKAVEHQVDITQARSAYVKSLWNITENLNVLYEDQWNKAVDAELIKFVEFITNSSASKRAIEDEITWTFSRALLYSVSIITTIGYGDLAPKTVEGRVLTMLYAVFGVPLMLLWVSNIGTLMANTFKFIYVHANCCAPINNPTQNQKNVPSKKNSTANTTNISNSSSNKPVQVVVSVCSNNSNSNNTQRKISKVLTTQGAAEFNTQQQNNYLGKNTRTNSILSRKCSTIANPDRKLSTTPQTSQLQPSCISATTLFPTVTTNTHSSMLALPTSPYHLHQPAATMMGPVTVTSAAASSQVEYSLTDRKYETRLVDPYSQQQQQNGQQLSPAYCCQPSTSPPFVSLKDLHSGAKHVLLECAQYNLNNCCQGGSASGQEDEASRRIVQQFYYNENGTIVNENGQVPVGINPDNDSTSSGIIEIKVAPPPPPPISCSEQQFYFNVDGGVNNSSPPPCTLHSDCYNQCDPFCHPPPPPPPPFGYGTIVVLSNNNMNTDDNVSAIRKSSFGSSSVGSGRSNSIQAKNYLSRNIIGNDRRSSHRNQMNDGGVDDDDDSITIIQGTPSRVPLLLNETGGGNSTGGGGSASNRGPDLVEIDNCICNEYDDFTIPSSPMRKHQQQQQYRQDESSTMNKSSKDEPDIPISLVLFVVLTYILAGAGAFAVLQQWDFIEGAYFCFITLSTIGLGDITPGDTVDAVSGSSEGAAAKLVFCCFYLVLGLAIIAMSFNLVQEKVTVSMKNFARRIGVLRVEDEGNRQQLRKVCLIHE